MVFQWKILGKRIMVNVSVVVLLLIGVYVFLRWFERANVWHPSSHITATPSDIGLKYEEVFIETGDQVEIHGWFIPCDTAMASLLFCHGNGGNISWRNESLRQFHSIGLNVFIFDYRGYGRSGGSLSEEGTYLDGEAAYDWLKQRTPEMPLVLFGRSMGAAIATHVAYKHDAAALIFESGFTSIPDIGKDLFPLLPVDWINTIKYDNLEKIPRIAMPVLVIHSPQDDIIPYRHGKEIFEAAKEPKQFFDLKGGHNDGHFDNADMYLPALKAFIEKHTVQNQSS